MSTARINTARIDARIRPQDFLTDARVQVELPEEYRFVYVNLLVYVVKLNATNESRWTDGYFDPSIAPMVPGLTDAALDSMIAVGLVIENGARLRLADFEMYQTSHEQLVKDAEDRAADAERTGISPQTASRRGDPTIRAHRR